MDVYINVLHEMPDGKIVRTYGANKFSVSYFDNERNYGNVCIKDYLTWKLRRDLKDFPNAKDPILPYVFDLHWDIKYLSDLIRFLPGHDDEDEIRELMVKHNISI